MQDLTDSKTNCMNALNNFVLSLNINTVKKFLLVLSSENLFVEFFALHVCDFGQLATPAAALAVVAHPTP
jgi:hypothetical protein